jgi:hypothetical protein
MLNDFIFVVLFVLMDLNQLVFRMVKLILIAKSSWRVVFTSLEQFINGGEECPEKKGSEN